MLQIEIGAKITHDAQRLAYFHGEQCGDMLEYPCQVIVLGVASLMAVCIQNFQFARPIDPFLSFL